MRLRVIWAFLPYLLTGCSGDNAQPRALAPALDSVASPAAPGSAEPNLAVAPDGRVYMSWLEKADSGHALRFAVLQGDEWSAAQTIHAGTDFFANWADFPSIIALDDTHLAAHWLQRTGRSTYAYSVRISQSTNGGRSWSIPAQPHRDSSQTEHGFVVLWPQDGRLGAAWLDGRKFGADGHDLANEMMLVATTLNSEGSLGVEQRLDERTCDCCQNAVALTSEGPLIAYRNRTEDEIRDIYITRLSGGQWTTGVPLHDDNWQISACPVNGPAVAAAANDVAIAWFTAAADTPRVRLAFSNDAGRTFHAPIRIDGGNPAGRVDVVLLSNGDALVTWLERTEGDAAEIRARRVSAGGRAYDAVTIAQSSGARASGFPRMVRSGGYLIFAWTVPGDVSSIRVGRAAESAFRAPGVASAGFHQRPD